MISLDVSTKLDSCLLCDSRDLRKRVALRPMPIATPNFTLPLDRTTDNRLRAGVPLDLWQCHACGHLQVGELGDPELQYRDYVYTTSLSLGLPEHFARYGQDVIERYNLQSDDLVVELGSNDGTLLRVFKAAGMRVQGVDPARRIAAEATRSGIPTSAEFFGSRLAAAVRAELGQARAIIANNVIANIRDLNDIAQGVRDLLAPDGVFIFETQYALDVIDGVLLDTVYHEHISYFLATSTAAWLRRHALEIVDIEHIASKGGSIRVVAQAYGGPRVPKPAVAACIAREAARGAFDQPYFDGLKHALDAIRVELSAFVAEQRARGKQLAGYGVSVGTMALLPQLDLTHDIAFLVDDDPRKEALLRGPDYAIPILTPAELAKRSPSAVVIFAWRYADAIVGKHSVYLRSGGQFIVPIPALRFVRSSA